MLEEVPEHCVVQRYCHRPFLLDGLKFDLRVYVLVSGCDPLRVLIHKEGLVRLATKPYVSPLPQNLQDSYMHLTNFAINKTSPDFFISEEFAGHKRSLSQFFSWLGEQGHDGERLWAEISDIAVKTACLVQPTLSHLYRTSCPNDPANKMCFQVIGLDIFLDYKLKPYLLEVNHTPSFATDSKLDLDVKSAVVGDVLQLLGLNPSARTEYKNQFVTNLVNRAVKGVKEIRVHRQMVKAEALKAREELEQHFGGGFQLIYPSNCSEEYNEYLEVAHCLHTRGKTGVIKRSVTKDIADTSSKEKGKSARKVATPDTARRRISAASKARQGVINVTTKPWPDKLPELKPRGNFVVPKVFLFADHDSHS